MLSVVFQKPGNAYSQKKMQSAGASVSGGGHVYALEEYNSNRSFSNGLSPWAFLYEDTTISSPVSTAESNYSEAYTGLSSAEVTFASVVEWFAINIAPGTNSGADISEKTLEVSAQFKTTSSNLAFVAYINGKLSQTSMIAQTGGAWAKRTFYVSMPVLADVNRIIIGVFSTSGSGSAYIDDFSIVASGNYTDVVEYTYITFSPAWNDSGLATSTDPSSYICVFTGGQNKNIGSRVQSVVTSDNINVTRVNLLDAMPYIPAAGNKISILSENVRYRNPTNYSLSRGIISANVSTEIGVGYSSANVKILTPYLLSATGTVDFALWRVTLYDEYGELFDGVVTSVSESGVECELTISGFSYFLDKVRYAGYFESSSSVTIRRVLFDVLGSTKVINGSGAVIDRNSAISTLQSSFGGIGPLDFTKEDGTMRDAIDVILELGTFDDTYDMLFLQIYGGATPVLKRAKRKITIDAVDYIVGRHNVKSGGAEWTVDVTNFSNVLAGTYTSSSGGQSSTANVYNVNSVAMHGLLEDNVSSGGLMAEEIYLVLQNGVNSVVNGGSVGDISVFGNVLSASSGIRIGCGQIRAGDVVMLTDIMGVSSGSKSSNFSGNAIVVGATSYDCFSRENSITPFEFSSTVESMLNTLTVS